MTATCLLGFRRVDGVCDRLLMSALAEDWVSQLLPPSPRLVVDLSLGKICLKFLAKRKRKMNKYRKRKINKYREKVEPETWLTG